MTSQPKLRLSRLREIGWKHWDPIGLGDRSGAGPAGCEDEYDGYLVPVVGQLRRTSDRGSAIQFLLRSERDQMGCELSEESVARAEQTVDAILADSKLWIYA